MDSARDLKYEFYETNLLSVIVPCSYHLYLNDLLINCVYMLYKKERRH